MLYSSQRAMIDSSRLLPDPKRAAGWRRKWSTLLIAGVTAVTNLQPNSPTAYADDKTPRVDYLSPKTVRSWIEQGRIVTFLDVRVPEEYAAAHLPNAINIYYSEVTAVAEQLLPSGQPIVVYCTHSAYRAPAAAKILGEVGVNSVYVLEGGIVAWHAGGLTILAENEAEQPNILPPPDCTCRSTKKS